MFNKKLIAGGILAVASSAAVAAPTFSFTAKDYSAQGNLQVATIAGPAITTTLGANYAVDDLITFNFSDDLSAIPSNTLTAYLQCNNAASATVAAAAGQISTNNGGTVTLGILTNGDNTVTYRVTGLTYAVTGVGAADVKCITTTSSTVGGIFAMTPTFTGSSVRASGATSVTYSASLSNGTTLIDGGTTTVSTGTVAGNNYVGNIVTVSEQFAAKILPADKLTGIIDVAPTITNGVNRGVFTAASVTPNTTLAHLSTDAFTIQLAEKAGLVAPATVRSSVTTILGDFSWIDDKVTTDTDTAVTGIDQNTVSAVCLDAAGTVVVNAGSITVGCVAGKFGDIVVTFDNENNVGATDPAVVQTMLEGTYTASTVMTFTDLGTDGVGAGAVATNTVSAGSALAAGGFGINGSTSVVQAYPVSDAITGFLWVTNAGSADAAMSVTAVAAGSVMATCELGNVAANSLVYVTADIEACLTAASITSGRTQLSITVDAPSSDINVYAGYKVDADSDRLSLTVN